LEYVKTMQSLALTTNTIIENRLSDKDQSVDTPLLPLPVLQARGDLVDSEKKISELTAVLRNQESTGNLLWELLKQVKKAGKALCEYTDQINIFCRSRKNVHWSVLRLAAAAQINCDNNLDLLHKLEMLVNKALAHSNQKLMDNDLSGLVYSKRYTGGLQDCADHLNLINSELEQLLSVHFRNTVGNLS